MEFHFDHSLWGQHLVSDIELGTCLFSTADESSIVVQIRRVARDCWSTLPRTAAVFCPDKAGNTWLSISRSGADYILDFPGLCSFRIDPVALLIEYAPEPDANTPTLVHLILDHALPRLISLLPDYFVLHASAWVVSDTAILLLGQSGAGKSTLASWFGAQGYPILTDDCLVLHRDPAVGRWVALPSYPSVRLWPDSIDAIGVDASALREFAHYTSKRRTDETQELLRFATAPAPLGGAFVLKPADAGKGLVERCSVSEAFAALALGVFRLEIASLEMNRLEFEILTDLLEKVPFWSVSHGNDYTQLPELQQRMLAALR